MGNFVSVKHSAMSRAELPNFNPFLVSANVEAVKHFPTDERFSFVYFVSKMVFSHNSSNVSTHSL